MGLYLIAASDVNALLSQIVVIVEVAVALGAVIFVHELGHFAVAKMCGVKCEKFYLGFDVYGMKLCKFQWGETEYGIGILPIGGYVKMLGQEDNPARAAEELERARTGGAAADQPEAERQGELGETDSAGDVPSEGDSDGEAEFDPRSYVAKSVPQRMAIISAGVIMNVIFAFLCAMVAYSLGVNYTPGGVGSVEPGSPAWTADLQVGDDILAIGDIENPRMRDVMNSVVLGDIQNGVELTIQRPGVADPFKVRVDPEQADIVPTIGVGMPMTPVLNKERPVSEPLPASRADGEFLGGDRIVRVGGEPVENYADLHRILAQRREERLEFVVERAAKGEDGKTREATITVDATPLRRLGLAMEMGPITAVQELSPAAAAGLKPGDVIESIDGEPVADPIALPDMLRHRAGETVKVAVRRGDSSEPLVFDVPLREVTGYTIPLAANDPLAAPAMGVAFRVLNKVKGTLPGTPAEEAGIAPGTEIVYAELEPQNEVDAEFEALIGALKVDFTEEHTDWPFFISRLQSAMPDTKVKLTLSPPDKRVVTLTTVESPDLYSPRRGIVPTPATKTRVATSFSDAMYLGARETYESVTQVYLVIRRMLQAQVKPQALSGPLRIATYAGYSAYEGLPTLLTFLALLSANLAVINFLPIPLLDGGHMVFLLWEGIRGKPANENVILAFHYAGFLAIISLMFWVLFLDVNWLVG